MPLVEETASGATPTYTEAYGVGADGLRSRYQPKGQYTVYQWDPSGSYVQSTQQNTYSTNGTHVSDTGPYEAWGKPQADLRSSTGSAEVRQDAPGYQGQFGAYRDYETGLVFMGHRYYDPTTGRFLNRDPKGYGGGINLYGFAGNNPVNMADPDGTKGILVFVHGTLSDPTTWTPDEIAAVSRTFQPDVVKFFNWAPKGGKSTANRDAVDGPVANDLADFVQALREEHPGLPVALVAHSNGGNASVGALMKYSDPGAIDLIVRLGSPPDRDLQSVYSSSSVIDAYDGDDAVAFNHPLSGLVGWPGGLKNMAPSQPNWRRVRVISSPNGPLSSGVNIHMNMTQPNVWRQLLPTLMRYGHMERFR